MTAELLSSNPLKLGDLGKEGSEVTSLGSFHKAGQTCLDSLSLDWHGEVALQLRDPFQSYHK